MRRAGAARNAALSALLGLPGALFAHALVFGAAHTMGGALHGATVQAASGFAVIAALLTGFAAVRTKNSAAPSVLMLLLASGGWLAAFELSEPAHAVPIALCVAAIVLASALFALVICVYSQTVRSIAAFVCMRAAFAPQPSHVHFFDGAPRIRRIAGEFALFSRPPPALS